MRNWTATHRLAEVVVALAIVLLVTLLVVLWTGTRLAVNERTSDVVASNGSTDAKSSILDEPGIIDKDLLRPHERRGNEIPQNIKLSDDPRRRGIRPSEYVDPTWGYWKGDIMPSNNRGDKSVEHVVIAKAEQNTYEDPIDENSKAKRHHSGHFRHNQNKVWDPHPQYEFTAFGRRFHLSLGEDSNFVPPGVTVTHIGENTTRQEYPDQHLGCFYSGREANDPKSVVAVSLCHGMTGHISTSTGSYLIKPVERWNDNEKLAVGSPLQHIIYRLSNKEPKSKSFSATTNRTANDLPDDNTAAAVNGTRECGVIDHTRRNEETIISLGRRRRRATYPPNQRDNSYDEDGGKSFALETDLDFYLDIHGSWRTRRALPREYFIEIMVVADAKMIEYHGDSLTSYILVLMNMVSRIYKDPSIGNPISIAVIKIQQVDKVFGVRKPRRDGIAASEMLGKFCDWQQLNNPHEPSSEHHDTALLLTRENLCNDPEQELCDTLGLAELGSMCSNDSSCAIVQDNGLATAFTIAHEIGHVLNMPHDDVLKCNSFQDPSGINNIMSRMLDDNTVPWEWSKCSRHYVTDFLDKGSGNCLLDHPRDSKVMTRAHGSRLPGEDYSENKQCELVYGPGSEICPHMAVCKRLWCTVPYWEDQGQHCHTQHMPWADGTVCEPGKWCHRGECVSREHLEPVDGQWSEWSDYGECSRTCGGGVKKKSRECNNPSPKNGGNYCVGERVRYRSCGTKECPPGSVDFRQQQCSKFDGDNRNIRGLPEDVVWYAKYTRVLPEERCKLLCQVDSNQYYQLRDKVIDGTPCGLDTFNICVNGLCKPAGCDHMLNSTAALDTCGVCRGDNSTCQRITGSFNVSMHGYIPITKIPAGSSYIDIRQSSIYAPANDSNYLVLRLKENGTYILNGNYTINPRKIIVLSGVTMEYSGPEPVVERLNCSRPIKTDLILEVLSVGNETAPQITYEYTVPKKILNRYMWVLNGWTSCHRICQGMSYRRAVCQNVENKDIMPNDYCPMRDKPREETRTCNNHCVLQWQEDPYSRRECSSHCGPGTMHVRHICMLVRSQSSPRAVPSNACDHLKKPPEIKPCMGPCEYAHWEYGSWSACSVTCGGNGFKYRMAKCVDDKNKTVPENKCPADNKIIRQSCGHKSCPHWTFGDWTPCSVTCGIGKRERQFWCQTDNRVLHYSHCMNSGRLPKSSEACDAGPCSSWRTEDWGPCSTTCGSGIRRRAVYCEYANRTISRDCSSLSRPASSIICQQNPCPTKASFTPVKYSPNLPFDDFSQHENDIDSHRNNFRFRSGYAWDIDGFEECSKSCGGGLAKQIIKCISVETREVARNNNYCDIKERPKDTITCNEHRCPTWTTGDWSPCDVPCGDGYQHRQVLCQDLRRETVNDSYCSEKTEPPQLRKCHKTPCTPKRNSYNSRNIVSYKWRIGPWEECSASCGNGVRRREVTCHSVNSFGWLDPTPTTGCSRNKPISEKLCNIRGCNDAFYWKADNWRNCSHPCGHKGKQTRRLFCFNLQGKKVRRYHCSRKLRPQHKRKCNQKQCTGPASCLEVQSKLKTNIDGEYTLSVGGRYMSIYCYGMDSNEPLEYLTLPNGERENYAEIYDKRLQDPFSCPYKGKRNESCDCVTNSVTISGRTFFNKVRINVHTLYVIVNDYRFAIKIGKNNVEYGKAGDCYSQLDCPQGRFGINLSGTMLMLDPEVDWIKQGNAYLNINKISNQRVIGTCGGYCGYCKPSRGVKLNVLPP